MPADQAAGLRRRSAQQPASCIHCFFEASFSSTQLMHALHQLDQTSLLVDMRGRLFADSSPRSLFDWKQQLERNHLNTLPQAYGDGWYAPGLTVDAPNLPRLLQGYDSVVFDAGPVASELALLPGMPSHVIIEVHPSGDSMQRAYSMLKTLFQAGNALSVGVLGEASACNHIKAACCHFLEQSIMQIFYSQVHEDVAFAALAVRMTDEETHRISRCI
ncbi:MAG: hypothetical protein Q8K12_17095 [Thiobacillus sp.]|nr:hypothetical protein [Thiobacillus sp.]